MQRTSWRQVLKQNTRGFIKWLNHENKRFKAIEAVAQTLETYFFMYINEPEMCKALWELIPAVRAACNNNDTYKKFLAAEAYAYVHLLDRYWRTWDVLLELAKGNAIPMGQRGIEVLDVGTGPAPSPYAICDFYSCLREYGRLKHIEEFEKQDTYINIVEQSSEMCHFLHIFSEISRRPGPFGAYKSDFNYVNPAIDRRELRERLVNKECYDPSTDDYFSEYDLQEANNIAQRHQRYRLLVFSNFLTLNETVKEFEPVIRNLFTDLNAGAIVMVLGAKGNKYEEIYNEINTIAADCGLIALNNIPKTTGGDSYKEVEKLIKQTQYNIFKHFEKIIGSEVIDKGNAYPDYWNPNPSKERRTEFGLRVFRKGR